MKVKTIMLLFQILAISMLKSDSAHVPDRKIQGTLHPMGMHCHGNHLCLKVCRRART
uniref:Uncharacterized protein n=1 Tax=Anguilla anguilla TaxID=7936 RepID=A0A0E9WJL8_ANGAN